MEWDAHTRLRLRGDRVAWKRTGEEIVALQLRGSEYLSLSGSGAALWQRLVEPTSVDELAAWIVQHYGVDAQTARADVEVFIDELAARDLLEQA